MQKNTKNFGWGFTAGCFCLLLEFCWIYPLYTGSYEVFGTSSQDGVYYLAGGLLIGLLLAIIFALAIPRRVQEISAISAAIAFISATAATYASLFFIEIVEWITMVAIGASGTLLLVSTCYIHDIPRGNHAIVECLVTSVLFLTFNAWLVGTSWAFRHVGVACAAAILLISTVRIPSEATREVQVEPTSPLLSTLAGVQGVITIVSGTIFVIIAVSWIQSKGEHSLVQATMSDMFSYSGLMVAVCLSLVSIYDKARNQYMAPMAPRSDGLGLAIFAAASAFDACVVPLYLTNVGIADIDLKLFLFPGAIAIALFLPAVIILERASRRAHVMAIIVLVLLFAGVAFLSRSNYPSDWTPLGVVFAPIALAGTAIGVLWLVIKRPWKVARPTAEVGGQ
jgi:hypothetical protein